MAQLTSQYPDAAARVFVDILNEPDSFQLQWQAQDDAGLPGAGDLYLAAMDAIYPVNSGEPRRQRCTHLRVEHYTKRLCFLVWLLGVHLAVVGFAQCPSALVALALLSQPGWLRLSRM